MYTIFLRLYMKDIYTVFQNLMETRHNTALNVQSIWKMFWSQQQSTVSDQASVPHLPTTIFYLVFNQDWASRAFSYAGPIVWNSLPAHIQNMPDTSTFKKRLMTYLFNSAF